VEDAWYQLLPKPYKRKNAAYDSLEELHMVRGITDDFWSTFIDTDPNDPRKRDMTVWGQGAVNINTANALTLYALVCSGAPKEILCTDPAQMQLFVMAVTMAQGITMGAPLFGSPADFITAVKGKGMLGPLLTTIGVKPVTKFDSESEFSKSIATESKVFSLYAVGVVKGFKRETRVKIHAVVDFRAAPVVTVPAGGATGPTPPGAATAAAPGASATPGQDLNSIAAALQPSVGGQVLYYTIE
jgi:general secretion pathway protein K